MQPFFISRSKGCTVYKTTWTTMHSALLNERFILIWLCWYWCFDDILFSERAGGHIFIQKTMCFLPSKHARDVLPKVTRHLPQPAVTLHAYSPDRHLPMPALAQTCTWLEIILTAITQWKQWGEEDWQRRRKNHPTTPIFTSSQGIRYRSFYTLYAFAHSN